MVKFDAGRFDVDGYAEPFNDSLDFLEVLRGEATDGSDL